MPCTGMGGRPLEIGSGSKRRHLFLKTVCMHACMHLHTHIYIYTMLGKWRTMSCLQEIQILKKKVKPNLLWPKLQRQEIYIYIYKTSYFSEEEHFVSSVMLLKSTQQMIIISKKYRTFLYAYIFLLEEVDLKSTSPKLHLENQVAQNTKQWPLGF